MPGERVSMVWSTAEAHGRELLSAEPIDLASDMCNEFGELRLVIGSHLLACLSTRFLLGHPSRLVPTDPSTALTPEPYVTLMADAPGRRLHESMGFVETAPKSLGMRPPSIRKLA